jgi:hypothetical protein
MTDCVERKKLAEAKDNPRVGYGSGITNRESFMVALNAKRLSLPADSVRTLQLLQSRIKAQQQVFYVDTEFLHGRIIEITVLDVAGDIVVSTPVDYGVTVSELYTPNLSFMEIRVLSRIFGAPSAKPTSGMTPRRIASLLRNAKFDKNALFVEWSNNRCDWRGINKMLTDLGEGEMMPPTQKNI